MTIHILPNLLPDETLYSLVARIGQVNGYQNDQRTCEKLFGDSKKPRVADIAVNFNHFSEVTKNAYGGINTLIDLTTSLPLTRGLGLYENAFYRQLKIEKPLGLAEYSNSIAHLWRWCDHCLEEDIALYGSSFWHKSHQLPGVFVCSRHKAALNEANIPFRMRQQSFMHPNKMPLNAKNRRTAPTEVDLELAIKLACFVENAANWESENVYSDVALDVIFKQLIIEGLVTKKGDFSKAIFKEKFNVFLEKLNYIEDISQLINKNNFKGLNDKNLRTNFYSNTLYRILVIFWLFGKWELFSKHCFWMNIFNIDKVATEPSKETSSANLIKIDYRKVCINFLHKHPNATKTDFWQAAPKVARWLTMNDRAWAEETFITESKCHKKQSDMFDNN